MVALLSCNAREASWTFKDGRNHLRHLNALQQNACKLKEFDAVD